LPLLRESPSARVVITASEVHNPKTGGGRVGQPAGLGTLAGMQQRSRCRHGRRHQSLQC
jgi:protochlorophyllide reductase